MIEVVIFVLGKLPIIKYKIVLYVTSYSSTALQHLAGFILCSAVIYFLGSQLSIFYIFYCDFPNECDSYFNQSSSSGQIEIPVPGRKCPACLEQGGGWEDCLGYPWEVLFWMWYSC